MEAAPANRSRSRGDQRLAAVILGNDAVVAARPNTPVQLAHACAAAGFDIVVPPSWGDELVAGALLTRLATRDEHVVIACSCPRVAALLDGMPAPLPCGRLSVASPPVAAARYLREVHGKALLITYVGDCPSAGDPSIDARLSPAAFLSLLERDAISLDSQPSAMESSVSERWRRYASVPGGLPALRFLGRPPVSRVLRSVAGNVSSITALGATRADVVGDLADAAHCACGRDRDSVQDLEPVRSTSPVVARPPGLDLEPHASPPRVQRAVESEVPAERTGPVATMAPTVTTTVALAASPQPLHPPPVAPPAPLVNRASSTPAHVPSPQPHRQRQAVLAAIPALVLAGAAALGVGTYAMSASNSRHAASGVEAGTRPEETATRPGGPAPQGLPREPSPNDPGAAPLDSIAPATPAVAASAAPRSSVTAADDSIRAGDATSAAPVARGGARRSRRAQVVPGWLPQGASAWTPNDTMSRRKPDAVRRTSPPAAPDTSRFEGSEPDSSRAEA